MINERLENAFEWCKKNNLDSTRLKKFNRESKKKQSKKKQDRVKMINRRKRD